MKSPLTRFRSGEKDKRRHGRQQRSTAASAQLQELAQAEQDMNEMREWCDGLIDAADVAANCAYEFGAALEELGSCLLQKAGLNDDEEIGRVLLMLGKEQFAVQKRLDAYRTHVLQTIRTPSDSLQKELLIVEDMKRQCDEKRSLLNHMIIANKEKRKFRNSSRVSYSAQEMLLAQEEYDQEVNAFAFRLKSLKQGQCRSLLTQAMRHHSAQLNLFRKGSKVLETVEPVVEQIAAEQHIECWFVGLEDDGSEEDDGSSFDSNDDSELSFDYGQTDHGDKALLNPKSTAEEIPTPCQPSPLRFNDGRRLLCQSAPIYCDGQFDPAEKFKELHASLTRKSQTYVLPTPTNIGNLKLEPSGVAIPVQGRKALAAGQQAEFHHTSSLATHRTTKILANSFFSDTALPLQDSVLKEHNDNSPTTMISDPSTPGHSLLNSSRKKVTRHAFSGPLTSTAWSGKLRHSTPQCGSATNAPLTSTAWSGNLRYSAPTECSPINKAVEVPRQHTSKSPRMSPSASPSLICSPKINELHALPKPPLKPTKSSNITRHSAPLMSGRGPESLSARNPSVSFKPTPLPKPPGAMIRSFSIPSSSQRMSPSSGARLSEVRTQNLFEDVASPPLTPMALINAQPEQKTE